MVSETLLREVKKALYYKLLEISPETMNLSREENVFIFNPFSLCHAEFNNN